MGKTNTQNMECRFGMKYAQLKDTMRNRRPLYMPLVILAVGILLQMNLLGIFGNVLPKELKTMWPLLFVSVGLDFLFTERRFLGGIILLFTGAAFLASQLLPGGQNSDLWKTFTTFWPILIILYGVDCLFADHSSLGIALAVAAIVISIYAVLNMLDIPIWKKIPSFDFQMTSSESPWKMTAGPEMPRPQSNPNPEWRPKPETDPYHQTIEYPDRGYYRVNTDIKVAGGTFKLQQGGNMDHVLSGKITLAENETLSKNQNLSGDTVYYSLHSRASSEPGTKSQWDLFLNPNKTHEINVQMYTGRMIVDFRGLNLSGAKLSNNYGNIDVMAPLYSETVIHISNTSAGTVRVFIPRGGAVLCHISGTENVEYPNGYYFSAMNVGPYDTAVTPVELNIEARGNVKIIAE